MKNFVILLIPMFLVGLFFLGSDYQNLVYGQEQIQMDEKKLANTKIPFIQNQGQINSDEVKYYVKTFAGTAYVTDDGLTYSISGIGEDDSKGVIIKEKFLNSNGIIPNGIDKSETVVNYFKGEQENWRSEIPTYNSLSLGETWNEIDVELKAYGFNVEKLFLVNPGGAVDDIKLGFEGVTSLLVSNEDELILQTEIGTISMTSPIAYQYIDGIKKDVPVSYWIDQTSYGFIVGSYNKDFQLVIDPHFVSTFIGGSSWDRALAIAIDGSGRVYVAGYTDDDIVDYPTTTGAYDEFVTDSNDVFVSRLDADLTTLQASTFIGGQSDDRADAIAIDGSGRVYVAGYTNSDSTYYPTTNGAYDETYNGGYADVFVSRLDADLTTLQTSTFIGGRGEDRIAAMEIDGSGRVYVTGYTINDIVDYPTTTGAYDDSHNGRADVFVSRLDAELTEVQASTFIGGSGFEQAYAMTIDSSGRVYVAGLASPDAGNYPITTGAYDETHNEDWDAFVSRLDADLTTLQASTFIGGDSSDSASYEIAFSSRAIAIDGSGRVYVAGTASCINTPDDFHITTGAYDETYNGHLDVFVSRLDAELTEVQASTLIGQWGGDYPYTLSIDSSGRVYVAGTTNDDGDSDINPLCKRDPTDFPTTTGAYDETFNGRNDAFVSRFNADLTELHYSTLIGGSTYDSAHAIAIDGSDRVYVAGTTNDGDIDFPTTTGAYDETHNGNSDVFISRFQTIPLRAEQSFCFGPHHEVVKLHDWRAVVVNSINCLSQNNLIEIVVDYEIFDEHLICFEDDMPGRCPPLECEIDQPPCMDPWIRSFVSDEVLDVATIWSEGQITDSELFENLELMVNSGDIRVDIQSRFVEDTGILLDYTFHGGKILDVTPDIDSSSLLIPVEANQDGLLTITLPRELIDAQVNEKDRNYIVLANGEELDFVETTNIESRLLAIPIPSGTQEIEIIGSFVVPEFGSIAVMILAITVISIIALSSRTRLKITG